MVSNFDKWALRLSVLWLSLVFIAIEISLILVGQWYILPAVIGLTFAVFATMVSVGVILEKLDK